MADQDVRAVDSAAGPGVSFVSEEVRCPLCGGGDYVPFLQAASVPPASPTNWFHIVQCRACKLCFTNPRPTAATIGGFYGPSYEPHRQVDPTSGVGRERPTALRGEVVERCSK